MNDAPNMQRRRLLTRTGVFLAGLAGIGLGATARSDATQPGTSPSVVRMTLHGANWRLVHPNRARGILPGRGQRSANYGELLSDVDGSKLGEFYASSFQFGEPFGHSAVSAAALETHQFNLPDGTLVGVGTVRDVQGGESVHAIVGGTGLYEGASGSYVARQNPVETGGDGTAEFSLSIILRSA